jgi:signal transduction histidine kinase
MSPQSPPLLEALLALRDPLSRIALATTSARRMPLAEEAQRLAEIVQCALADADWRIEELARALAGSRPAALEPTEDCRSAFADVCRRAAVAARARGIALDAIVPAEPVAGDAAQVRRAALRLLRVTHAWADAGGRVQLVLSRSDAGPMLAAVGRREGTPTRAAQLRDLLTRYALADDAKLGGAETLDGDALALTLALGEEPVAP